MGGLPPRLLPPVGMKPLDLEIDGHLRPLATAKGDGLTKLAPQLPDLIDAFIDRAQSHAASHRRTPPLTDLAQTLAQPATEEYILIQIQPKTLELLQDREGADHIMPTLLAFQHGHLQVFQMPPSRLQIAQVLPIAGKLIGRPPSPREVSPNQAGSLPPLWNGLLNCSLFLLFYHRDMFETKVENTILGKVVAKQKLTEVFLVGE